MPATIHEVDTSSRGPLEAKGVRMDRAPDTVGEMMTRDVVTVDPDHPVKSAIRAMVERDIGSVVVVEDGMAIGVFTERDLTLRLLDESGLLERRMREVMSSPPVVTGPDTEVVEAFDMMNARRIRRLPIVKSNRLVGIVTERDLLRWVGQVARE